MAFPVIPTVASGRLLTTFDTTPATATFPSLSSLTKNAGDLLIAIIAVYQSTAAAGAVFSGWGGGFTEFVDQRGGTTQMSIGAAYKWSNGAETGTFDVTVGATVTGHAALILMSIPGAHATTPPEGGTIAVGTTAAADPAALNPAGWDAEDTLWIAVGANGETGTGGSWTGMGLAAGPPTNYGNAVSTGESADVVGGVALAVAFRQFNAASEDIGPWSSIDLSNARNVALPIAVRPAPPPPPTATSVGRVSLASGNDPTINTGHSIKVRARKTGGTGTVTLTCALYEGVSNRSGDLTTSELTTSLTDYTLPIPEASAANITDYSNLEIRFNGDSSTGDSTSIEIAQLSLQIPEAASVPIAVSDSGTGDDLISDKNFTTTDINSNRTETPVLAASNSVTDQQSAATQFTSLISTNVDDQQGLVTETSASSVQHARTDIQTAVADTSVITSKEFNVTNASTSVTESAALAPISTGVGDSSTTVTESSSLVIINSVSDIDSNQIESEVVLEVSRQTTDASTSVSETSSPIDRQLTASDSNSSSGETVQPLAIAISDSNSSATDTSSKEIAGTTTPVGRVSLATGYTPLTRTQHKILVRARKTDSGHTGSLFVRLYEGATPRSASLEISALTTSLANYELNISDSDAESITDYSDLELRFHAVSAAGDPMVVEIAELSLSIPSVGIFVSDNNISATDSSSLNITTLKTSSDVNSSVVESSSVAIATTFKTSSDKNSTSNEISNIAVANNKNDSANHTEISALSAISNTQNDSNNSVTENSALQAGQNISTTDSGTGNDIISTRIINQFDFGSSGESISIARQIIDSGSGADNGTIVLLITAIDSNTSVVETYSLNQFSYAGFADIEYPLSLQLADVSTSTILLGTPSSIQLIDAEASIQLQIDSEASIQINEQTTALIIDNADSDAVLDSGQAELELVNANTSIEFGDYNPPVPGG